MTEVVPMIFTFFREIVVPIVVVVFLPVFFWFKRDKRKSEAETKVAERTVGVDVTSKEAGGLGAAVAFVQAAFNVERESKDREILNLSAKVARLERQHEEDAAKIVALEAAEEEKDGMISDLRRQVASLTKRLSALEAITPPTDPKGMPTVRPA